VNEILRLACDDLWPVAFWILVVRCTCPRVYFLHVCVTSRLYVREKIHLKKWSEKRIRMKACSVEACRGRAGLSIVIYIDTHGTGDSQFQIEQGHTHHTSNGFRFIHSKQRMNPFVSRVGLLWFRFPPTKKVKDFKARI
jgi:hypothetical protein